MCSGMHFVPFQTDRLLRDDGKLLEATLTAASRAIATLGAVRATMHITKGKEEVQFDGTKSFRPVFDERDDVINVPGMSCRSCASAMPSAGVLCARCKGLPVRLRAGPPLINLAWEGSDTTTSLGQQEAESLSLSDHTYHFSVSGIRFGKTLVEIGSSFPSANICLRQLGIDTNSHFIYTVVLDKERNEQIESVSTLMRHRLEDSLRQWIMNVESTLRRVQEGISEYFLDDDDQLRLDRTRCDLARLIARHVALQDDDSMCDRLNPTCLEKMALCEYIRCSSKSVDRMKEQMRCVTELLHLLLLCPSGASVRSLPSRLTDFLFSDCPVEVSALLPKEVDLLSVECSALHSILTRALHDMQRWRPQNAYSLMFHGTTLPATPRSHSRKRIPPMDWCTSHMSWVAKRWSHRTGLDAAGTRIVRLIYTIWELQAKGEFRPGVVHGALLRSVGNAYISRSSTVCEWAVQILQPTLLRANLVNAKALICDGVPEVEDEIETCVSLFSHLALDEVLTLTSPQSRLYQMNYWKIAERAASYMKVKLPQLFYRDFVRVILPIAVAHLSETRQRRGIPVEMRSNWIADALFREATIVEIARLVRGGHAVPPIIFVPRANITNSAALRTMDWLCAQPRRFMRHTRCELGGETRYRGFEIIASDLMRVLYQFQFN